MTVCKKHDGEYVMGATSDPHICGICFPFKANPFVKREPEKHRKIPPIPVVKSEPHDPMLPFDRNFCKCSSCGEYFGGEFGFVLHRKGGQCLYPGDVTSAEGVNRLSKNERGYWVRAYA